MKNKKNMCCDITKKTCLPCTEGIVPLKGADILELQRQLDAGWRVVLEHHLEREYLFHTFAEALDFTNRVGALAEMEGHHPDIHLSYGRVAIELWTHKIDGLSESDFILAAKIDCLFSGN